MTDIILKSDFDVELIQSMGDDLMIAKAAWVSTGNDHKADDESKVDGLLKFLIKNKHGTPFEHGAVTLRVNVPIFLWREWHRHRIGFSYNEQSGRYMQLAPVFYFPSEDRFKNCVKPEGFKPSKPGWRGFLPFDTSSEDFMKWKQQILENYQCEYDTYEFGLKIGLDNGLARIDLPVGLYSACYVTCNPRSLMNFLSLRTDDERAERRSHPQWEMHKVAEQTEEIFKQLWPITHKLWNENGRVAP